MYVIVKVLKMMLLFIFVCLLLPSFGLSSENNLTIDEDLEIERQLKLLNKPAIKTIVDDGDIYDCVDIYKQPAFDHPSLKNHKIQLRPNSYPDGLFDDDISSSTNGTSIEIGLKDGNTCPSGTVPIRRVSKDDLIRMRTSFKDMKMNPPVKNDKNHIQKQWAVYIGRSKKPSGFSGVSAFINVYGLPQVMLTQFSSSLAWLVNNLKEDQINIISVGWTVSPVTYGDNKTRLTAGWTIDNYQKTGCQDTSCPGFVQLSKKLPLGFAVKRLSTYGGKQYGLNIIVFKDPDSKNWWLFLGKDRELIGYWPNELFTALPFNQIHFGGTVGYIENSKKPPMGSGHFPIEGIHKSCLISNIRYANMENKMQDLELDVLSPYSSLRKCYYVGPYFKENDQYGNMFFFGGPENCP
ncbi:hypothetical protein J5N97_027821 [Dioscorea zingiberensis]|uniref:Neprosin PEP catalytic domain-containing protein n=1 Tax=Dioscorea zingiberensis TaxID=325984 RepID=A0A9D5BXW3_9LILI|nr:hypothetical protein J5N97_027821 [Dioscorea zingiberensis]